MLSAYRAVAALLIAIGLAVAGNGLVAISLPLAADAAGWSKLWIGFIGAGYFTGMLIGAFMSPPLIRAVGHDRAYMAAVALAAAVVLGFALAPTPITWILFRAVMGFAYAVLYSVVESWLQGSSDNGTRGRILGFYSVIQNLGTASGNQAVSLDVPGSSFLFELAAVAIVLSIVPIALSSAVAPPRPARPTMPFRLIWRVAPLGLVGVFLIGLANGPFWSLAQVYAADLGFSPMAVGTFMTCVVGGGALAQIPIGMLSDRYDRRLVLGGLLVATLAFELVLAAFGPALHWLAVDLVGLCVGAVITTQYYVVIAHVNDRTGRENVVGIAALVLFVYCIGAMVGPVTAAWCMEIFGAVALHLHNAVIHIGFLAYVIWRMVRADPPADKADELATVKAVTF